MLASLRVAEAPICKHFCGRVAKGPVWDKETQNFSPCKYCKTAHQNSNQISTYSGPLPIPSGRNRKIARCGALSTA